MAWRAISREGLALLALILLNVFSMLQNPENDILTKILLVILYLSLIPILMYTPKKNKEEEKNDD